MKTLSLLLLLAGTSSMAAMPAPDCKFESSTNGVIVSQQLENVQWEIVKALPNGMQLKLSDERVGINDYDQNAYVFSKDGHAVSCTRTFINTNGNYDGVKSDCGGFSVSCVFNWYR